MDFKIRIVFLTVASLWIIIDILITVKCRHIQTKRTGHPAFQMESFFFMGAYILKKTNFVSKRYRKRIKQLEEIYEPSFALVLGRNAEYATYTYIMILFPVCLLIFGVAGNAIFLATSLPMIGFVCVYFDLWLSRALGNKHTEIQSSVATMLSKMTLLINAGVTANDAFEKVAFSAKGVLYTEMQDVVESIKSGVSYDIALENFCTRCGSREIRKFVSVYRQNMYKGGSEFPLILREMTEEAFEDRKNRARLAGGVASQKLLIPIMLMFVGVLIMVIVPAFENLF